VDADGGHVGGVRELLAERVAHCRCGEADDGEHGASDWFEQDVKTAPNQSCNRAEVGLEVGDGEIIGEGEQSTRVRTLRSASVMFDQRASGSTCIRLTRQKKENRIRGTPTMCIAWFVALW